MYPNRRRIRGQRHWKLAKLDIEEIDDKRAIGQREQQREEFMNDLEEDPEYRSQFDLYRGKFYSFIFSHFFLLFIFNFLEPGVNPPTFDPDGDMDDVESDFPEVSVNELIDAVNDLRI